MKSLTIKMDQCTKECQECMADPDTKCAMEYPAVWNKVYSASYDNCKKIVSSNCESLEKMYKASLKKSLLRKSL